MSIEVTGEPRDSPPPREPEPLAAVDIEKIESVVLRRLIAEVRNDRTAVKGYDRVYNRHNR